MTLMNGMPISEGSTILFYLQHFPGYGSPECWKVRLVWDNRELVEITAWSLFTLGLETRGEIDAWRARELAGSMKALSADSPQAFPLCTQCGKPCDETCITWGSEEDRHMVCSEACRDAARAPHGEIQFPYNHGI